MCNSSFTINEVISCILHVEQPFYQDKINNYNLQIIQILIEISSIQGKMVLARITCSANTQQKSPAIIHSYPSENCKMDKEMNWQNLQHLLHISLFRHLYNCFTYKYIIFRYFTQQCCLTPFLNNALNQRSQQKHPGTWCILKQEKRGQTCKSCKHAFERSRFQNQEINNEISGLFCC